MIDCERHVVAPTLDSLFPYMEKAWVERLRLSEFVLPQGATHPGVEVGMPLADGAEDVLTATSDLLAGIELAILAPTQGLPSPGWLDHVTAAVFVAALNDYVTDIWVPAEPRFRQAIALAPNSGELAAKEVRRCAARADVVAACMSVAGRNLGHAEYQALYDALAQEELPLIVHPSGVEGTVQGGPTLAVGGPYTPEESAALLPQIATACLASLIFEGVFERFPALRVVFAGFGFDWAPPVLWRMDAEWRGLRVEVPWVRKQPSEYIAEHVRFVIDGASGLPEHSRLWDLVGMLPEQAMLWGSDAPFADAGSGGSLLAHAPPGTSERLDENARLTFLGLKHTGVHL